LEEEQKAGRFREDLFFRLNVITIDLPPLRNRHEDIPALVEHLLSTRQIGTRRHRMDAGAMQAILNYNWPGNVRELANVLERAQILAEGDVITLDDLPETLHLPLATPSKEQGQPDRSEADSLDLTELERRTVLAALDHEKGNKAQAAKRLGTSRRTLYRLMEKYGLAPAQGEGEGGAPS
jgi:two-component system response regulator AtoC